ncbi:hypothetical protein [Streptomyces tropicalis]|uniref:Lipoprotein n=1 Tax=Streptomyces tropicalis TaxID=3034234 RepID=A0ABT6A745_9ACTN|nr:hypothetical protein [Streptomyces tropicalis]MDF3300469.1 hypothetical protein [Streptomyces tropicalis]
MRIRATVAAALGALALTALAVPAAQAVGTTPATGGTPYTLNVSFSNYKIAPAVKVGTTNEVSTTVTYTLTHGADVDITAKDFYTDPFLYRGSFADPSKELYGDNPATCTATSSTTAACTATIDIYPADGDLQNVDAGKWTAAAEAIAFNGQSQSNPDYSKVGYKDQDLMGSTLVQRYSKLTADAAPEPVKKGSTITVTGKLSRANWEDHAYHGYTGQSVKLQFRKAGTSTYTTLKTVTTDSTGNLRTTTTAGVDGYYRFSFAGTSTTPAVSAAGDYVDVQ